MLLSRLGWPKGPDRYPKEPIKGEIRVQATLENSLYRELRELGKKPAPSLRVDALVDIEAVRTLMPPEIVRKLGLMTVDRVMVTLADKSRVEVEVAGPLTLSIGDRSMCTDCLVGPPGCEPRVGRLVMEGMDLMLDPKRRALVPRPYA